MCAACVWLNERHIAQLPGVLSVQINYSTHRARVRWDDSRIKLSEILRAVNAIGYLAHPYDADRQQQLLERERKRQLRHLVVAGVLGMQVMMLAVALYQDMETVYRDFFRWVSLLLTVPVLLYSAQPFFRAALRDLRHRQAGMDVPVALGISIAFGGSVWATWTGAAHVYFDSVTMFVFFLLAGRYLEFIARKRAAEAAESLVHLAPAMATRVSDGIEETVPVAELRIGDRIRIRPGEGVPADGKVLSGRSSVNESLLTGESLPVAKRPDGGVIAGSINVESVLEVAVERVGADTVLSGILRLLERAQTEKPASHRSSPTARPRGSCSRCWFSRPASRSSGGSTHPRNWLPITVAVLVVTCPCALSLAYPDRDQCGEPAVCCDWGCSSRGDMPSRPSRARRISYSTRPAR